MEQKFYLVLWLQKIWAYKSKLQGWLTSKFCERKKREKESKLFMVSSHSNEVQNDVWFLDSGCSNHMTNNKSLFKEHDDPQKCKLDLEITSVYKLKAKVLLLWRLVMVK